MVSADLFVALPGGDLLLVGGVDQVSTPPTEQILIHANGQYRRPDILGWLHSSAEKPGEGHGSVKFFAIFRNSNLPPHNEFNIHFSRNGQSIDSSTYSYLHSPNTGRDLLIGIMPVFATSLPQILHGAPWLGQGPASVALLDALAHVLPEFATAEMNRLNGGNENIFINSCALTEGGFLSVSGRVRARYTDPQVILDLPWQSLAASVELEPAGHADAMGYRRFKLVANVTDSGTVIRVARAHADGIGSVLFDPHDIPALLDNSEPSVEAISWPGADYTSPPIADSVADIGLNGEATAQGNDINGMADNGFAVESIGIDSVSTDSVVDDGCNDIGPQEEAMIEIAALNEAPPAGETLSAAEIKRAEEAERDLRYILATCLFDPEWYVRTYPGVAVGDALRDFVTGGWREMRDPNPWFSVKYYLTHNLDVVGEGVNPLVHYILYGDSELRQTSVLFDTHWYNQAYGPLNEGMTALEHYILFQNDTYTTPTPHFDPSFYLSANSDVREHGANPFQHFMSNGYKEGRDPSASFSTHFYRCSHLNGDREVNPLIHWLTVGRQAGLPTQANSASVPEHIRFFSKPGASFETFQPVRPAAAQPRAKVIAFYLPQYHSFPENDAWWGTGFTEWTNLAKGSPRYVGHYQPRIPRDLGFYDLSNPGVLERQAEMAQQAGIHGFSFYFYWFNGKRLMEKPLEYLLANPQIDLPFCLTWANENWTRRWDGMDSEILIRQDYSVEDDAALIDTFVRYFEDPRYIRVAGRPLLTIYRPGAIPNAATRIDQWRALFTARGHSPYLMMVQGFGHHDPRDFGLDAALEFPPHKLAQSLQPINSSVKMLDLSFTGHVYRYADIVDAALAEPEPPFPLVRGVSPSWDNDARRQGTGVVFDGSTPDLYARWLDGALDYATSHPVAGESLVFVNAWNEWAEGAYLEPDLHHGSAYLNATSRVVHRRSGGTGRLRYLLVGHDAYPHGAQFILLSIARSLVRDLGAEVEVALLGPGPLVERYQQVATTHVCTTAAEFENLTQRLRGEGVTAALVNTVAAAHVVAPLKQFGYQVTTLVHELPRIIHDRGWTGTAKMLAERSDHIVFPAAFVRDRFLGLTGGARAQVHIYSQGLYNVTNFDPERRAALRAELGLAPDVPVILNVGYADLRKGFDIFVEAARAANRRGMPHRFMWVGNIDGHLDSWILGDGRKAQPDNLILARHTDDVGAYYAAADIFLLTSREDPFPSVVMEAMHSGAPVVAFAGCGGFEELLADGRFGRLVDLADIPATLNAIESCPLDGRAERAAANAQYTLARFSCRDYAFTLLRLGHPWLKKVSVVLPSFNYAQYMAERLSSILDQTYPIYEIHVLDDASSDDSVAVAQQVADQYGRSVTITVNSRNSGNVFHQWRKGVGLAQGDVFWIAEADDSCSPHFLSMLCADFDPDSFAFAFSDSQAMDGAGALVMPTYRDYCNSIVPGRFDRDFVLSGREFARTFLAVKNVVLNVSGVIWSATALRTAIAIIGSELETFKVVGDWRLYLEAAGLGRRVGYVAAALNKHRRHQQSVTHELAHQRHFDEVTQMQDYALFRFSPDLDVCKQIEAYREVLIKQFNLPNVGVGLAAE